MALHVKASERMRWNRQYITTAQSWYVQISLFPWVYRSGLAHIYWRMCHTAAYCVHTHEDKYRKLACERARPQTPQISWAHTACAQLKPNDFMRAHLFIIPATCAFSPIAARGSFPLLLMTAALSPLFLLVPVCLHWCLVLWQAYWNWQCDLYSSTTCLGTSIPNRTAGGGKNCRGTTATVFHT